MPPQERYRDNRYDGDMTSSGEILSRPPPRRSDESMGSEASYGGRGYYNDEDYDEVKSEVSLRTANTRALIQGNSFVPQPSGPYVTLPQTDSTRGAPPAKASRSSAQPQRPRVETDYRQSPNRQPAPTTRNTYNETQAGYGRPSNPNSAGGYEDSRPTPVRSSVRDSAEARQEAWDDYQRKHGLTPTSPAPSTVRPERSREPEADDRNYNRPQYGETLEERYRQEPRNSTSTAKASYKDERSDDGYRPETRAAPTSTRYGDDDRRPKSRSDKQGGSMPPPPPPPLAPASRLRDDRRDATVYSNPSSRLAPPSPVPSRGHPDYIEMPRAEEYQTRARSGPGSPAPSTVRGSYDDKPPKERSRPTSRLDHSYSAVDRERESDQYDQRSNAGTRPESRRDSAIPAPTTVHKQMKMPERPKRLSAAYSGNEYKEAPGTPKTNPRSPLSQVTMNYDGINDERSPANPTRSQTHLQPPERGGDYFGPRKTASQAEYKDPYEGQEEPYEPAVRERKRNPRPAESPRFEHAVTDNRPEQSRRTSQTGSNVRSDSTASTVRRDKEAEVELKLARLRDEAFTLDRSRRIRMEHWERDMGKRLQGYREQLGTHLAAQLNSNKDIRESVHRWNVNPEATREKLTTNNTQLLFDFTEKYNTAIRDVVKDYCDTHNDDQPSSTVMWNGKITSRVTEGEKGSLEEPGFRVYASYNATIAGKKISNQIKEVFGDERRNRKAPIQEVFEPTIGRDRRIEDSSRRTDGASRDGDRRSRLITDSSEYQRSQEDREYERERERDRDKETRPKQKQIANREYDERDEDEESRGTTRHRETRTVRRVPSRGFVRSRSRRREGEGGSKKKSADDEARRRRRK